MKIWLPYYQGERTFTGEVPGMGLGLSLVRSLLWRVGGSCFAANRPDGPGLLIGLQFPLLNHGQARQLHAASALINA